MNAAFARSIGVLSGVITTAGAAVPLAAGVVVFSGACSCAQSVIAKPARQIEIARDFKKRLLISKTFRSEVQSDLSINTTITGAGPTASGATKTSKRATQRQRLTKIR